MIKKIVRVVIPVVIILAGIGATWVLIANRKPPRVRKQPTEATTLVRTISVRNQQHQVFINKTATTQSMGVLPISSEVKGKVVWISPRFVEGGRLVKGEPVFKINPADYALRIGQTKSALIKAEYDLAVINAKKNAAVKERELLKNTNSNFLSPRFNQYESDVIRAQSALESAKANYQAAKLDLDRTAVLSPFSGYIRSVSLSEGQLVSSGQTVGQMIKEKPIQLKVQLPLSDLVWVDVATIPGINGEGDAKGSRRGSEARVSKKIGKDTHQWKGYVARQLREMDAMGKMATVIVEVENIISDRGLILPFGLFVDVTIKGKMIERVIRLPHEAMRQDFTVWLAGEESRLAIRQVSVLRENADSYFISDGLKSGDQIVVSTIQAAIPGMKLGIFGEASKSKGGAGKNQGTRSNLRPGGRADQPGAVKAKQRRRGNQPGAKNNRAGGKKKNRNDTKKRVNNPETNPQE